MPSTTPLFLSRAGDAIYRPGARFDGWALGWTDIGDMPAGSTPVSASDALRTLCAAGAMRRVPIGVIGPRTAEPDQTALAEELGRRLGEIGLTLICGGLGGVMEAVCRGCASAGGQPIGILPGEAWREANPYVAVPIATGLGSARNAVIARAAMALVAIGGGYGTLSEIAFGLRFGRLVLTMLDAPAVPGVVPCATVQEAIDRIARWIFGSEPKQGCAWRAPAGS